MRQEAGPRVEHPESAGRGWRFLVGTLAGLFLGAVFLVAVWAKMFDIGAFTETVGHQGIDFLLSAEALAYLALAVETAVGLALLLNLRRLWLLVPVALLVAFLLYLNVKSYLAWAGGEVPPTTACGCFGSLVQRTPGEALWQDALLMVPAMLLAFVGRPRGARFPPVRTGLVALGTLAVVGFASQAPGLPLEDLPFVTRLHAGDRVEEICAGKGADRVCLTDEEVAPDLREGRHVVVLAQIGEEGFAEAIAERLDELIAWDEDPERSRLLVLHAGEREDEFAFELRSRAAPVELRRGPYPLLRSLYRSLPRTFLVDDGAVVRAWNGLPPFSEVVAR